MGGGIAGSFVIGDGLPQGAESNWPFKTEADLRAYIRAEVHAVLDDLANELKQSKAFQPVAAEHTPSGICWACREYGKAEEMMWYEHHLIHSTVECVRAAEVKPEQREHRG